MRKGILAALTGAAALAIAGQASAAITIKFEALSTTLGVTGGFTAVVPYLPLSFNFMPSEWITECHIDGGASCGANALNRITNDGSGDPTDIADEVIFGVLPWNPAFRFANNVLSAPGVHDTLDGWVNVGRITISGSVDGPPRDYTYTPPLCDPDVETCPGVGAVPEPSTWAMAILGFFGVGSMMRRRRTTFEAA